MACNCRPIQTIQISSVTTTDTGVVLIPSNTIENDDLINLFKYRLIIPCNLSASSVLPVYIQTALGNIPLLCSRSGNSVMSNNIRKMTNYILVYGNENSEYEDGQFVLRNSVC